MKFEEWLAQQDGVIEVDCGCVTTEAFYHWMRVAYEAGNSPVVPDDVSIFEAAIEECKKCDSIDEHAWNHGVLAVIAEYESCRAAMLAAAPQSPGSEPATVPGKWIPVSERMPDEAQPVIVVSEGGVVQRTVYQYCEGVWSDWYDMYDDVNVEAFTHWMLLPAAPQKVK
ncbi:TPA: DUF551 domain-containing protein [Klebsiella variicola subsp. variicola]|nr:DUF551 domain-containing protein [Klebsiella variicola subsp. variicola]